MREESQPEEDQKIRMVSFRITERELKTIQARAGKTGLGRSEYIRRAVLGNPIASKTDQEMVRELKRLGALMKHQYPKHSNWTSQEKEKYWTLMNQVTRLATSLKTIIKGKG